MSGIFSPKNLTARPLSGSVMPRYSPIGSAFRDGSLGKVGYGGRSAMHGSVLPNYTPITSIQGLGVFGALGAGVASMIPGDCWDVTGFKDCHGTWFAQAQKDCQGGEAAANFGGDMDACTDVYADQYAMQNCVPKYCPQTIPVKQSGGLTAAQVTAIQKACNAALTANGYKTIAVDGKLGPATCGAASYLLQNHNVSVFTDYNMSLYCTTFTNPTKVGSTVPMQTTVIPEVGNGPMTIPQWGQPDPTLASTQQSINRSLDAAGYNMIAVTGVLDSATCGAMQWMKANMGQDLMSSSGQNCQAFTPPTKKAVSQSPSTAPKGSTPPTVAPPTPIPPGTHPITSATMLVGGLALAAAGGLYYYAKKKGMV